MTTLGRQPETIYVTPSNPSPWYGAAREGDRFTAQQHEAMAKLGLDESSIEVLTVRREATSREMWWPTNSPPPVYQFDCPVLTRRKDGKVQVIAPGGWAQWVFPNGWARLPSRLNRNLYP